MRDFLSLKHILLFFLPLIFVAELHQISHTILHAFLARLADPKLTLAAFSIAFALCVTLSTISQVSVQGGISFITDRVSFWRLFRFFGTLSIFLFLAVQSVAQTPMGDIMFGKLMGASKEVVKQARETSAIMAFWFFPVIVRHLSYALLMIHRRTILITYGTVLRLFSLGIFLIVFPFYLEGAAVGGAALVACVTVETIYMAIVARPFFKRLEKDIGKRSSYFEIWRFSWPLMITQGSERGVILAINFSLGQLSNPDLALAGFGIVNGLMRTCLSPLRNLIQTAQALVRSREDLKIMFTFTFRTLLFFIAIVILLFYSPLRKVILENIMGLTLELSQYTTPGLKLTFLMAIFWGYSSLLRGLLSAMRRTGALAFTAGIRLLIVIIMGSITFFLPYLNGAVVGTLAEVSSFAAESLFLGFCLWRHFKTSNPLFPHL